MEAAFGPGDCKGLVIAGAGGHGKVVAAAAEDAGFEVSGFLDDGKPVGSRVLGYRVLGPASQSPPGLEGYCFIVAIGDNYARAELFYRLLSASLRPATIVHPKAHVSRYARLGAGVFVAPGAVVQPDAVVGDNVIVNTSASIDHDSVVYHHSSVNPQGVLAGGAVVGYFSYVHTNAAVIPLVRVGDNTVVGAGAVVVRDIPDDTVAVGVPARPIKENPGAPCRHVVEKLLSDRGVHVVKPDRDYRGRTRDCR